MAETESDRERRWLTARAYLRASVSLAEHAVELLNDAPAGRIDTVPELLTRLSVASAALTIGLQR